MNRRNFLHAAGAVAAASTVTGGPSASAADAPSKAPQEAWKPVPRFGDGRDWIFEKRFGLFNKDPMTEAVKLKPIDVAPRKATLLNTGRPVEVAVDLVPSEHIEQKAYLRLKKLPVNDLVNTVMVVKLEFDKLPEGFGSGAGEKSDILRR